MTVDLDKYLPAPCGADGCDQLGPFATDDGPRCLVHSGLVGQEDVEAIGQAMRDNIEAAKNAEDSGTAGAASKGPSSVKSAGAKRRGRATRDAPADDMNDTAARALASLVLQHTADALTTDTAKMEGAITGLSNDLPAPLEVAAAILFATTALAGTAGLTDQEVFTIGQAFEDQAIEESEEPTQ